MEGQRRSRPVKEIATRGPAGLCPGSTFVEPGVRQGPADLAAPPPCTMVCYADDTLVLAAGEDWEDALATANLATARTVKAIKAMGLRVAAHKTEAMYFYKASTGGPPQNTITVNGEEIEIGRSIK